MVDESYNSGVLTMTFGAAASDMALSIRCCCPKKWKISRA